jgi:hypothetical protein
MIMNSEFCFTPQMQQYILGLPLPHQDVVRFYTGFLSPKSMSADEIAKKNYGRVSLSAFSLLMWKKSCLKLK